MSVSTHLVLIGARPVLSLAVSYGTRSHTLIFSTYSSSVLLAALTLTGSRMPPCTWSTNTGFTCWPPSFCSSWTWLIIISVLTASSSICSLMASHTARHSACGYIAAAAALPPIKCTCSWLLSHFFSRRSASLGELVMNLVGFITGPSPFGPTEVIPKAHMCATTVCTPFLFMMPLTQSKFHDVAVEGCSCKKYLSFLSCSSYISQINAT